MTTTRKFHLSIITHLHQYNYILNNGTVESFHFMTSSFQQRAIMVNLQNLILSLFFGALYVYIFNFELIAFFFTNFFPTMHHHLRQFLIYPSTLFVYVLYIILIFTFFLEQFLFTVCTFFVFYIYILFFIYIYNFRRNACQNVVLNV